MGTVVFKNVELDPVREEGTNQLNGRMTAACDDPTTAPVARKPECVFERGRERAAEVENESEHNRY